MLSVYEWHVSCVVVLDASHLVCKCPSVISSDIIDDSNVLERNVKMLHVGTCCHSCRLLSVPKLPFSCVKNSVHSTSFVHYVQTRMITSVFAKDEVPRFIALYAIHLIGLLVEAFTKCWLGFVREVPQVNDEKQLVLLCCKAQYSVVKIDPFSFPVVSFLVRHCQHQISCPFYGSVKVHVQVVKATMF